MMGIFWGVEVYKLSTVFVCVVDSLLVPMYFLLQNTLSRILDTASVLMFHGMRGFCQFCILFLPQSDLVEGWKSLIHVPEFPYRMIGEKHGKHHISSRLVEIGVHMPQGR